jgi:hypothetical protein
MLTTRTNNFPASEDNGGSLHNAIEAILLTLVGPTPDDTRNGDVDEGGLVAFLAPALFLPGIRVLVVPDVARQNWRR